MWDTFWKDRGQPWEHDPGPQADRRWAKLFAETPNYRGIGKALLGGDQYRWHFGPMFYRGRLADNAVKVLIIGQEGAQDESLAHRSFVGGTGARMQHFLRHIGISHSYLFLNTFVYPIFGQYDSNLRWMAQHADSPIVKHRHAILNYVAERNDLRLIIGVGRAAKETVETWIQSRGGICADSSNDISQCNAAVLGSQARAIGVMHPGGAGQGGSVSAIIADFKRVIAKIEEWSNANPAWLPVDPGASRKSASTYLYKSAPIPFRDLPFGSAWRIGRGGTSSNRKDSQRAIQIFSASGKYNGQASYNGSAAGNNDGYSEQNGDLPYEPPKVAFGEYDRGPTEAMAKLLMGGESGLAWPDFLTLGAKAHPSFGTGPVYRGRFSGVKLLVIADQESHDDLFTGRALSGDGGQHLQAFLRAMGITHSYLILRTLPVDCIGLTAAQMRHIVDHAQVKAIYTAIVQSALANNTINLALTIGAGAQRMATHVFPPGLFAIHMKAWGESGALAHWRQALTVISTRTYGKDLSSPSFTYDGGREQIPRIDLPYGTLRWQGTSGDRAIRANGAEAQDYYKFCMPKWAFDLAPKPLSTQEQQAVDSAPG